MSSPLRRSADSVFAYRDALRRGLSPEEIDRSILAPIKEEAEAILEEDTQRVQAILQGRLCKMEQEGSELASMLRSTDITEAARESLKEQESVLTSLRSYTKELQVEVDGGKQKLKERYEVLTGLKRQTQELHTILRNIRVEPSWAPLANAGTNLSVAIAKDSQNDTKDKKK